MKIIADFHIHSPYSRATSEDMNLKNLDRFAIIKGINVLGTGDFTHPKWREKLRNLLIEENGLYGIKGGVTKFIISGEVCTNFEYKGKMRRIHHLILLPSIDIADELSKRLSNYGDLSADGRPNLSMSGAQLVEEVVEFGEDCLVIPAHVWTPWFSLFGDKGGVDKIEECYEDQTPHIYALETGLSSDPPMNWRISTLDSFTLISNSDSHSPLRIGREANIIEVKEVSYEEIVNAIMFHKEKVITIEVDPAYGKYHWTGHRKCGISMSPKDSIKIKGICPICGKKMTKGVAERVEELADRRENEWSEKRQKFIRLLPLNDLIATLINKDSLSSEVQKIYLDIVEKFGSELKVLLEVPKEDLEKICGRELTKLILMNRENKITIVPGYDGLYGKIKLQGIEIKKPKTLEDYMEGDENA